MKKQWTSVLLIVCMMLFFFPSFVGGHSYLELSSPKPDSTLEDSPAGIWVQFTEPIDTSLSKLRLEKENGEVIEAEQYSVDNSSMTLRLPTLENGVYYVYWQILSLDSHVTDGSFRFTVESKLAIEPQPKVDHPNAIDENDIEQEEQEEQDEQVEENEEQGSSIIFNRINTSLRSIDILTTMFIGGWLFFHVFLWREDSERFMNHKKNNRLIEKWVYLIAFFLFICTSFGHMALRASYLSQTTVFDLVFWQTMGMLFKATNVGIVSIIKPIIGAILVVFTFRFKKNVFIKSILLILLVVTFGYTSHAYHAEKIVLHTLHMLAMVIWFGGLVGLVVYSFGLKKDQESLKHISQKLKTFSIVAILMVMIVTVSGFLLSDVYLESWNDLLDTQYGNLLLWKIVLFVFIIVIAAFHRFIWLPKLNKVDSVEGKTKELKYLLWTLRLELTLVIIVLVIAGMLSTASPPADIHGDHHYYYH